MRGRDAVTKQEFLPFLSVTLLDEQRNVGIEHTSDTLQLDLWAALNPGQCAYPPQVRVLY